MLAMLGARRRYLLPESMADLGVLKCFVTDFYVNRRSWLQSAVVWIGRILQIGIFQAIAGRYSSHIPIKQIVVFRWLGIRYAFQARLIRRDDARLFAAINHQFCSRAAHYLEAADICWAYNGAALELFEAARERKIRCVLEQAIAPRDNQINELERARKDWSDWTPPHSLLDQDAADPLSERERAEWLLSDVIVTGSQYVYDCMQRKGITPNRCMVVPSAIDLERFKIGTEVRSAGPLRVLFVGQINLRKGVPYLLEAVRRLNSTHIQLKLVGTPEVPRKQLEVFSQWATFCGVVPLPEVVAHYQWADIVVVPSICEGSSMVTYEARGCGVPIVVTPNSGAFFTPGVDGLQVPVRSVEAIANTLDWLARNRNEVRKLRDGAITYRHLLGREAYRGRLRHALDEIGASPLRDRHVAA